MHAPLPLRRPRRLPRRRLDQGLRRRVRTGGPQRRADFLRGRAGRFEASLGFRLGRYGPRAQRWTRRTTTRHAGRRRPLLSGLVAARQAAPAAAGAPVPEGRRGRHGQGGVAARPRLLEPTSLLVGLLPHRTSGASPFGRLRPGSCSRPWCASWRSARRSRPSQARSSL